MASLSKSYDARSARYKFDMEQAEAMRRGGGGAARGSNGGAGELQRTASSRGVAPPPPLPSARPLMGRRSASASSVAAGARASSQSSSMVTSSDVEMALRGLDEAESTKRRGDDVSAMKLYELSIEVLVKFLNGKVGVDVDPDAAKNVDREVVAARAGVALTDAEDLKKSMGSKKGKKAEKSTPAPKGGKAGRDDGVGIEGCGVVEGSSWSISSTLSSMLGKGKGKGGGGGGKAGGAKSKCPPKRSSPPRPAVPAAASSRRTGSRGAARPTPPRRRVGDAAASQRSVVASGGRTATDPNAVTVASAHRSQQRRKRSNLDYANDPLVKIVKSDLYVDASDIRTTWSDVAGLATAKRSLQEAAILPLLRPDLYTGLRKPPKGVLLYGPPGTGKTMLVKAVARESKCILFACTSSALTSKWVGEGEKLVRTLFRIAADVAPSIVFFDEIDALLGSRKESEHEASRRFKTEFMVQVDGLVSGGGGGGGGNNNDGTDVERRVLVLGCTNCPWDIDDAVMRRFQRRIYVPLPDRDARESLLRGLLSKAGENEHDLTDRQISQLVSMTEGFSCSDVTSVANEASFGPLRDLGDVEAIKDAKAKDVRPINVKDFVDAISKSTRSVSNVSLERYGRWEREQAAKGGNG